MHCSWWENQHLLLLFNEQCINSIRITPKRMKKKKKKKKKRKNENAASVESKQTHTHTSYGKMYGSRTVVSIMEKCV